MFAVSCKRLALEKLKARIKLFKLSFRCLPDFLSENIQSFSYMFNQVSLSRNYLLPPVQLLVIPLLCSFISRYLGLFITNYIIHAAGRGPYLQNLLLSLQFSLLLPIVVTEHIIHTALQTALSLHINRHIDMMKPCNLVKVCY